MLKSGERFFPRFDLLRATTNEYKTDFKRLASFDSPFWKNRLNVITGDMFRNDVSVSKAVKKAKLQTRRSDITACSTL